MTPNEIAKNVNAEWNAALAETMAVHVEAHEQNDDDSTRPFKIRTQIREERDQEKAKIARREQAQKFLKNREKKAKEQKKANRREEAERQKDKELKEAQKRERAEQRAQRQRERAEEQEKKSAAIKRYCVNGQQLTLSEMANTSGISRETLASRLKHISPEEAMNRPIGTLRPEGKRYYVAGVAMTVNEMAVACGINPATVRQRLRKMTPEEAVAMGGANNAHSKNVWFEADGQRFNISTFIKYCKVNRLTFTRVRDRHGLDAAIEHCLDLGRERGVL